MDRLEFIGMIIKGLKEHPDWLKDVLDAIFYGMQEALKKANEKAAISDAAFLASLEIGERRLSAEAKEKLGKMIVRAVDPATALRRHG